MSSRILNRPDGQMRANFGHLYADVVWYGMLAGSTLAFQAIYAARLGGSSFQIGLLAAAPAVVNLFFSLQIGHWMQGRPLGPVTFWSSLGQRLFYLLLVLLPWLFPSRQGQVWGLILVTLLMSFSGAILAISFNAIFADVVPPQYRGEVVGKRNALIAVSVMLTAVVCGWILDQLKFPYNYQLVFMLGAIGSLMSSYHLSRLRPPNELPIRVGRPLNDWATTGLRILGDIFQSRGLRFLTRSPDKPLLRLDVLRGAFGPFMLAYLLFYTFQNIPLPLFPLFIVNDLSLSDGNISVGSALFYLAMTVASLFMMRMTARIGHRTLLVFGSLAFAAYPLILYLANGPTLYWAASIEGGAVWAVLNAGLINRLMERVPEHDRPVYMALHNLVLNIGLLAGSLAAPLLSNWVGLRDAMLVSTALRLAAGVVMIFLG